MVEAEIEAIALAIVDTLTGLYNRGGFARVADPALSLCRREKRAACLAALDLNRFKQINDGFGHAEGDRALCEFSRLLATSLRQSDLIARLGGDEFCVLFIGSSPEDSQAALRRLRGAVDRRNGAAGSRTGYELDYSVGLVPFEPGQHAGVAALLEAADHEMHERKRVRVAPPEA
jgi:diguanylate cyclase (GGDEF)-like protein